MDVTVLLFLPLVGGYAFARTCNVTRYLSAREEGHRLYFRAAFFGVGLFVVVAVVRFWLITKFAWYRDIEKELRDILMPYLYVKDSTKTDPFPIALIALFALVAGGPLGKALNVIFWKGRFLAKAIEGDYLEVLLSRAATIRMPVSMTLKSRKVYVGFVLQTLDPVKDRKWITILPLLSGYRDKDTSRLVFVTNYQDVYGNNRPVDGAAKLPKPLDHLAPTDFEITIPVGELQSVNLFDVVAYKAFKTGAFGTATQDDSPAPFSEPAAAPAVAPQANVAAVPTAAATGSQGVQTQTPGA